MDFLDFALAERVEQAETLPARCYTDPAYLELEIKHIFHRTWQLVGRLDQVARPGSYFTAEVAGEPVLIVRDQRGELRGFHNVCRHRASLLAEGAGQCDKFRCGYHGWTYDLTGKLIGVPDFDGVENFDRARFGLVPLQLVTWEQFVFAKIDPSDGRGLPEYLEDIPQLLRHINCAEMQFVERRDYVVECNWKVYVDNYCEGYHVPVVHPSLMRELDFQRYRTILKRFSSLQDAPVRPGNDPQRRYQPTAEQTEAAYIWVFPNLMLNLYPDNLSVNLILPLGHDRTLTIFEWFFHSPAAPGVADQIKRTVELSDEVQAEDSRVCEAVQKGLHSVAYNRGRYSAKRESGVHHFHSLWYEFMSNRIG
jgi:choline monooxygenase